MPRKPAEKLVVEDPVPVASTAPEAEVPVEDVGFPSKEEIEKAVARHKSVPKGMLRKDLKYYVSTQTEGHRFAVSLGGGIKVQGGWDKSQERVVFGVRPDLVERFERHHHFQTGRIIAVD